MSRPGRTRRAAVAPHPRQGHGAETLAQYLADALGRSDHLLLAVVAYEVAGSLEGAANLLGVSRSTITRYRRDLRKSLRKTLFDPPKEGQNATAPLDNPPAQAV